MDGAPHTDCLRRNRRDYRQLSCRCVSVVHSNTAQQKEGRKWKRLQVRKSVNIVGGHLFQRGHRETIKPIVPWNAVGFSFRLTLASTDTVTCATSEFTTARKTESVRIVRKSAIAGVCFLGSTRCPVTTFCIMAERKQGTFLKGVNDLVEKKQAGAAV